MKWDTVIGQIYIVVFFCMKKLYSTRKSRKVNSLLLLLTGKSQSENPFCWKSRKGFVVQKMVMTYKNIRSLPLCPKNHKERGQKKRISVVNERVFVVLVFLDNMLTLFHISFTTKYLPYVLLVSTIISFLIKLILIQKVREHKIKDHKLFCFLLNDCTYSNMPVKNRRIGTIAATSHNILAFTTFVWCWCAE